MIRPYRERAGRVGAMVKIDPTIKSKDVDEVIIKVRSWRNSQYAVTKPRTSGPQNTIFKLPGELRNKIYALALETKCPPGPDARTPPSMKNPITNVASLNILRLCKQMTYEARSMMEMSDTAYIPLHSSMDYGEIIKGTLKNGLSSISPTPSTILAALVSFANIHIHLHILHQPSGNQENPEPLLDISHSWIFSRLHQVLLIYTRASALNFQGFREANKRRKALVHLDHHFSDWNNMVSGAGPWKMSHLIRIMGKDTCTDWEVRLYVHYRGDDDDDAYIAYWNDRVSRQWEELRGMCACFPNIKLVAEVYGKTAWWMEGKSKNITRAITPSSTLWPSWPEDVLWRKFPRVRSDEEVLL